MNLTPYRSNHKPPISPLSILPSSSFPPFRTRTNQRTNSKDQTHRLHRLTHLQRPHHDDGQPSSTEGRDGHFVLHIAEFPALAGLARRSQHAHGPQFLQQQGLVSLSNGVRWVEQRQSVSELLDRPAQPVVFVVVARRLDVVSSDDGVRVLVGFGAGGWIGREGYFAEESGGLELGLGLEE